MLEFNSIADIGRYYDELQKIKTAMKKAGLLEQYERALEIEKAFETMLSKTPKPTDPQKRPVGRPRKHDPLETTQTPTPPQDEALKPSNKPKTHKKTKGQDDKPTDQENT